jgi:succinoglycan biosynthesis protein ExoA
LETTPADGNFDVLAVIPCLNESKCIAGVIDKIAADPVGARTLIVVADGGSTDGTREIVTQIAAQRPNVRLLNNPRRLQSAGVNLTARMFGETCPWLIRADAHADYPDNYVSNLIAEAERTDASSVVVAMRTMATGCFQQAAATAQNSLLGTGGSAHRTGGAEGFVDHGHHALFRTKTFLALNGYDEAQSHNEDAEFDVRLARYGGRIWLTRATSIGYFPRARAGALFVQYRNYGRGRAITLMRHRVKPKLRQLLPVAIAPAVALLALAPWIPIAALPALGWAALCLSYGLLLGAKEKSRCAAASGIAAMIMHLGWSLGFWQAVAGRRAVARPTPAPAITPAE